MEKQDQMIKPECLGGMKFGHFQPKFTSPRIADPQNKSVKEMKETVSMSKLGYNSTASKIPSNNNMYDSNQK